MGKLTKLTNSVTRQLTLEFVDAAGDGFRLGAEFRYSPADPLAVTTILRTGTQEVAWTFSRDLLIEGRFEPAGEGDVHVWPCLGSDGSAVVVIELSSPDGELLVQADTREIHEFVTAMLRIVPVGDESVDVDSFLTPLFV